VQLDLATEPNLEALSGRRLTLTYASTWMTSLAVTLLTIGIFFYTSQRFAWGAAQNMSLAAGQGTVYVIGALLSHRVRARWGARTVLVILYALLAILAAQLALSPPQWRMVVILLIYMFVAALNWPILESLVTAGADAREMSRRVGMYNIVWASSAAIAVAGAGALISYWPPALFIAAIIGHLIAALLIVIPAPIAVTAASLVSELTNEEATQASRLQHERTLALWLSRIALPASYVVNYALSALLPSLPVLHNLSPTGQTVCGSVWLAARFVSFVILGRTIFWHGRPRLLLVSAILMLIAFLGVTMPAGISGRIDLLVMLMAQIVLGLVMGMIYSGSLYFGMVLSDGSTEHGGYHEALIGLGSALGTGMGAATQWIWPGELRTAVIAVAGIVGISVIVSSAASLTLRGARMSDKK